MRNKHYTNKTMRIADETWEKLKIARVKSGKSWNLYMSSILKSAKHIKNPMSAK